MEKASQLYTYVLLMHYLQLTNTENLYVKNIIFNADKSS